METPPTEATLSEVSVFDPGESTPWRDAWELLLRPRRFFEGFNSPAALNRWSFAKGILVLCFVQWIVAYLLLPALVQKFVRDNGPYLEDGLAQLQESAPWVSALVHRLAGDSFERGASLALSLLIQPIILASPILALASRALAAWSTWFFLPWVGFRKEERSFKRLFLVQIYLSWLTPLQLLPGGALLQGFVEWLYWILAVKWIHRIGFARAFLAGFLLNWILLVVSVIGLAIVATLALMIGVSGT